MHHPDKDEFIKAIIRDVNRHWDYHTQGIRTQRKASDVISLGDEAKEGHQDKTYLQMEGQSKCSRQTAIIWTQLHGNLLTRDHLVLHKNASENFSHQEMAYLTSQLYSELSTVTNWERPLHEITKGNR